MAENFGKKRIQFFMDLLSNNLDAALQAYKDNPAQPFGFCACYCCCAVHLFKAGLQFITAALAVILHPQEVDCLQGAG